MSLSLAHMCYSLNIYTCSLYAYKQMDILLLNCNIHVCLELVMNSKMAGLFYILSPTSSPVAINYWRLVGMVASLCISEGVTLLSLPPFTLLEGHPVKYSVPVSSFPLLLITRPSLKRT